VDELDLLDWKRRVFDLYAGVRASRDPQAAWRLAATAWQRTSPGQRAALMRITKPPA